MNTDKIRAIFSLGLIQPIDGLFTLITVIAYTISFFHETNTYLLYALLAVAVWIVLILFRLGIFIFETRADINLLADSTANVAVQKIKAGSLI
jgi:hypothetical protein